LAIGAYSAYVPLDTSAGTDTANSVATGEDTWNGQVFDNGPAGNSDIGSLVTFKLTDARPSQQSTTEVTPPPAAPTARRSSSARFTTISSRSI